MVKDKELLQRIEYLRTMLNQLVTKRGYNFTHPEVLHVSKQLDLLINAYYRIPCTEKSRGN
ncbi:MAG: aspartyl-phosphate phosphatase Spo0E family protein [Peptococcaceae bacterium]|nr:aspartyl-phosphate phosphatase Spo0E family protein [Peptococcaceae bacterium]